MQTESAALDLFPDTYKVQKFEPETGDTVTLVLRGSKDTARARPGQFYMLYVFGVGEVPISVSGVDDSSLAFTVRAVGSATEKLVSLRKGATVGLRGPFGSGWPMEVCKDRDLVILAGGLGLAPLRTVVQALVTKSQVVGKVLLLYGAKTPADMLYKKELSRWKDGIDVQVTVDAAPASWKGPVGVVTKLLRRSELDLAKTVVFMCGPEVMMRVCTQELILRGISGNSIYIALERSMQCAVGFCGRCQLGPNFVCKDGPVFLYSAVQSFLNVRDM